MPLWQRGLLGGYAALFALLLPLICWGKAAETDHAHAYPHFVFADPVFSIVKSSDPVVIGFLSRHASPGQHHAEHEIAAHPERALPVCALHPAGAVNGRATPTLMLFFMVWLLLLGAWAIHRLDQPHFTVGQSPHFPKSLLLPVPLPPPRLHCSLA